MMKKIILSSILIMLMPLCVMAQIQQIYIRTKGTSINRKGNPIAGVLVCVNGLHGAYVSAKDGKLTFNLQGGKKQFSISKIVKSGYELLTPLASAYKVSSGPLVIVMQSKAEKRTEEVRILEKIEKTITKNYEKKIAELQEQKETFRKNNASQSKIKQIEEEIAKLNSQYIKRNDLIDKMVEKYVNLDYATLDEHQAQFSTYIENGELEKADSLINTMDLGKIKNVQKKLDADLKSKEAQLKN